MVADHPLASLLVIKSAAHFSPCCCHSFPACTDKNDRHSKAQRESEGRGGAQRKDKLTEDECKKEVGGREKECTIKKKGKDGEVATEVESMCGAGRKEGSLGNSTSAEEDEREQRRRSSICKRS